jgi:hypothetical protein
MSKYASALGSHSDFHVKYPEFIDDLYLTYLFDPVGYSIIDVCFFIPHVHQELRFRPNSLLRHMLEVGLVKAHFRRFSDFDIAKFIDQSERPDLRAGGIFFRTLCSLRSMTVGGHLNTPEAAETAQILDSLNMKSDCLQLWPVNRDGSIIETGRALEELVSRVTTKEFVNNALVALGDHPNREAKVTEIEQVQEFIDKFIERQREYHPAGLGLRITSFLKAVAASYGITDVTQINSSNDLLTALKERGHSEASKIAKKALRVLADRHAKNMSDLLQVGYSNSKSDTLTDMLAFSDRSEGHDQTSLEPISMKVSLPGLRRLQLMPIFELNKLLSECGLYKYHDAFAAWNESPSAKTVDAVLHTLNLFEQSLKNKYPGENLEVLEATFWHRLSQTIRTLHGKLIICHIEAQGEPLRTAWGMAGEIASSFPSATKAAFNVAKGDVLGLANTLLEKVGKSKETRERKSYEQFALSRPVKKYYDVPLHRYKNFTRN